jgi:hypothetical protein
MTRCESTPGGLSSSARRLAALSPDRLITTTISKLAKSILFMMILLIPNA